MNPKAFSFKTRVWRYEAMNGWYFITLPQDESEVIKDLYGHGTRGFGSIQVEVTIGGSTWKTSIFPDKKIGAYVMPLKSEVRKKENIKADDQIEVGLKLLI